MPINRFGDYDKVSGYGNYKALPKGAYVMKIMGAKVQQNSIGQYVEISMDIAEGEYANFYADSYRSNKNENKKWGCKYLLNVPNDDGTEKDGWTKRKFKTFTEALEESNAGYHFDWDETKFKGKLIGGLFHIEEYERNDGKIAQSTKIKNVCSVDKLRSGDYKLPEDKLLARKPVPQDADGFLDIPADLKDGEEELPFD
jgi:hypothetical protein